MCRFRHLHASGGGTISTVSAGSGLLLDAAPGDPSTEGAELLRVVTTVLAGTCRTADLTTLGLRAAGRPELSLQVHGGQPAQQTLWSWPVVVPACEWHGGLSLVATAPLADPARRSAVTDAAGLVADLLVVHERRAAAEKVAARALDQAGRDALTGLGNRRAWRRALDHESLRGKRYGGESSVVVLDLDGLKAVNDQHGHAAGDLHLQLAAEAMRSAARTVDVLCRLGGDEFAVLAPATGADGAARLAGRLRDGLSDAGVAVSVGTATSPDGDLDEVWRAADAAMYVDKRRRRAAAAEASASTAPGARGR